MPAWCRVAALRRDVEHKRSATYVIAGRRSPGFRARAWPTPSTPEIPIARGDGGGQHRHNAWTIPTSAAVVVRRADDQRRPQSQPPRSCGCGPTIGATIHVHDDATIALLGSGAKPSTIARHILFRLREPEAGARSKACRPRPAPSRITAHADLDPRHQRNRRRLHPGYRTSVVLVGPMGRGDCARPQCSEAYHRLNNLHRRGAASSLNGHSISDRGVRGVKGIRRRPATVLQAEMRNEMYRFAMSASSIGHPRRSWMMHEEAAASRASGCLERKLSSRALAYLYCRQRFLRMRTRMSLHHTARSCRSASARSGRRYRSRRPCRPSSRPRPGACSAGPCRSPGRSSSTA